MSLNLVKSKTTKPKRYFFWLTYLKKYRNRDIRKCMIYGGEKGFKASATFVDVGGGGSRDRKSFRSLSGGAEICGEICEQKQHFSQ